MLSFPSVLLVDLVTNTRVLGNALRQELLNAHNQEMLQVFLGQSETSIIFGLLSMQNAPGKVNSEILTHIFDISHFK